MNVADLSIQSDGEGEMSCRWPNPFASRSSKGSSSSGGRELTSSTGDRGVYSTTLCGDSQGKKSATPPRIALGKTFVNFLGNFAILVKVFFEGNLILVKCTL